MCDCRCVFRLKTEDRIANNCSIELDDHFKCGCYEHTVATNGGTVKKILFFFVKKCSARMTYARRVTAITDFWRIFASVDFAATARNTKFTGTFSNESSRHTHFHVSYSHKALTQTLLAFAIVATIAYLARCLIGVEDRWRSTLVMRDEAGEKLVRQQLLAIAIISRLCLP